MRYIDFDLRIDSVEDGFEAHVLKSPAGEARHRFTSPFTPVELENLLLRLGRASTRRRGFNTDATRAAKELGRRLYDAVFAAEVRDCLSRSIQDTEREGNGLRIRLRLDASALADVPWEFLYDAGLNQFLALSKTTSVVRYLEIARAPRPLHVTRPLTILVVISSPAGYPELDSEQEWENLNGALRPLGEAVVKVERIEPTIAALQARLRKAPVHVLHFIGHGEFDERAQDGLIVMQSETGGAAPLGSEKLAVILHNHPSIRLAVLNCCEGARTSAGDPFAGVAPALIQQGLPAVVAMQFAIADSAAITFATDFYQSVADGCAIDDALVNARTSMFVSSNESFGAPVLYMRSDDGVLFDIAAPPGVTPPMTPAVTPPMTPAVTPPMTPAVIPAVTAPEKPAVEPQPDPPDAVQPPVTSAPKIRTADSLAFAILLWLPLSIITAIVAYDYTFPREGLFSTMLGWSHVGFVVAGIQSLLLMILRRWRPLWKWPELLRASLISGLISMLAPIPALILLPSAPTKPAATTLALCCWIVLYAVAQYCVFRRRVYRRVTVALLGAGGTAFAAALFVLMNVKDILPSSSEVVTFFSFAIAGAICIAAQGFVLSRAHFLARFSRSVLRNPRALVLGALLLLIMQCAV
ncbi:MAG TPA: CHAT domain-containing protein, partial [Thermoanaerobaculia bacterium]|nr:CHAT domain-containing protein [Thermoanaerobaculia bacterium]